MNLQARSSQPFRSLIMLPDTNAVNAWAYHDLIVRKARAKARQEHPTSRYIQTALGEHVSEMFQNRLFDSMVITDTITSELFAILDEDSAREWKILNREYGSGFEQQFGRGYLTWRDVKNSLVYNPAEPDALPGPPPLPLIPRKDVEKILVENHQPLGTWFQFLQRNLSYIDFTDSKARSRTESDRGEKSVADYITNAANMQLMRSPERNARLRETSVKSDVPAVYAVVSEDIKAFDRFAHTGKEVFVLNNKALVTSLNEVSKLFNDLQKRGQASRSTARFIPVPEPREHQTFEDATRILFDFLSRSMNIQTMAECFEVHYPIQPKNKEKFKDVIISNIRSRPRSLP